MSKWIAGLCALFVLVLASTAAAGPYHRVGSLFDAQFDGASGGDGVTNHQRRAAVKNDSGRLYLTDDVNDRIRVFDPTATGATEGAAFGGGEITDPLGVAVDQETGAIYVSDDNDIVKYTSAGVLDPSFTSPGVTGPLAFDQVADELVVADTAAGLVRHFTPTGAASGVHPPFDGSDGGAAFAGLQDVAVTSTGDVVIVDSDGDPALGTGTSRVERYGAAGAHEATYGPVAGAATVAVVPGSDYVVVSGNQDAVSRDERPTLSIFDPATPDTPNETIPLHASMKWATIRGLAVSGPYARLYVVGDVDVAYGGIYGNVTVQIYEPPPPAAAPVVQTTSATPMVAEAYVSALIHPRRTATTYYFEYGTTTAYGATTLPGSIPAGDDPAKVTSYVPSLTASTTYHYRVIAKNALGETVGPDRTFTTASGTPAQDACPNAAIRAQTGASDVPDCRAYEQVTPTEKAGADINASSPVIAAGDTVAFASSGGYPGAAATIEQAYSLARRSSTGWAAESITAPQSNLRGLVVVGPEVLLSPDLTKVLQFSARALAPGAFEGGANLYVRDNATGGRSLAVAQPPGSADAHELLSLVGPGGDNGPKGASTDGSRFTFASYAALTPDAQSGTGSRVYQFVDGQLRLISRYPDGTPMASDDFGAVLGAQGYGRVMSDDGKRVYFANHWGSPSGGEQYLWRADQGTVAVSVSRRAGDSDAVQHAYFLGASRDGSIAYYWSRNALTDGAVHNETNIYRYHADTDTLDLVTHGSGEIQATAVTDDGRHLYFESLRRYGQDGVVGEANRYVADEDGVTYIGRGALVEGTLIGDSEPSPSASGRYIAFASRVAVPGLSNAGCGGPCSQVYVYDSQAKELSCASCAPLDGDLRESSILTRSGAATRYVANILDDGTVYFTSRARLVSKDVNGRADVYQWKDGVVSLVTPGTGADDAQFVQASRDGRDVYFITGAPLVRQDRDNREDLYVARVGGGIVAQNTPSADAAPACRDDACQGLSKDGVPAPSAGSLTFSDAGELPDAPFVQRVTTVKVSGLRAVRGFAATLRVKVSVAGTVSASGASVRTAKRSAVKAATYALKVSLTTKARASLRSKGTLRTRVKVAFKSKSGRSASTSVTVTFKRPGAKTGKRAGGSTNGAR